MLATLEMEGEVEATTGGELGKINVANMDLYRYHENSLDMM
jgi:hypothetical protein